MIPSTTTAIQIDLLIGRRWLVTGATGTVRDPALFPAYLRFTYSGDASGALEVSGCANGMYPVEYQRSPVLDVGQPGPMPTCEGEDDIGQELWKILALPLRWSVVGHELTLAPTTPSEYSLVLTETED